MKRDLDACLGRFQSNKACRCAYLSHTPLSRPHASNQVDAPEAISPAEVSDHLVAWRGERFT